MVEFLVQSLNNMVQNGLGGTLLLTLAFLAAACLFLFFVIVLRPAMDTRQRIRQQLQEAGIASPRSLLARQQQERIEADLPVEKFFSQLQQGQPDSLQTRLYRAGFYGPAAPGIFFAIRIALCAAIFFPLFLGARAFLPGVPVIVVFLLSLGFSLAFIVLPSIILDRIGNKREETCRRGFPDFMDMMIVCTDAGMSLEAAAQRVADEISATHKALGLHLKIMVLEMRAGRALRESLHNLAERLDFDEARTLSVLFKQSEELGASLTQTLRVYSAEMREKRITRAEEKANALPVKMVLPLGLCVFPVMLGMIMLPLVIRMRVVFF